MARIRTIKPGFFSSLTIAALPKATRLTFIGLWTYVDDAGRGVDDPRLVKADLWPLDDDYTARKVEADLKRLAEAGLIERYELAGRRYLRVVGFGEHQRINRPQPSKLPAPDDHGRRTVDSVNEQCAATEPSPPEGNKEEEGKGTDPSPPPQPTHGGTRAELDGGIIDQAVALAATRYASTQADQGRSGNPDGLARWWLQENEQGARTRAAQLIDEFDLTPTQLADALLTPQPRLEPFRRRNGDALDDILHGDPPAPDELERVHEMTAGLHKRLPQRSKAARR